MTQVPEEDGEVETREMFLSRLIRGLKDARDIRQEEQAQASPLPELSEVDGSPISTPPTGQSLQDEYAALTGSRDRPEADGIASAEQVAASKHSEPDLVQTAPTALETISIRELVQHSACSIRLGNRAVVEPLFAEWSVGEALSDLDEFKLLLLGVPGLGRKSVNELVELLIDASIGSVKLSPPDRSEHGDQDCSQT